MRIFVGTLYTGENEFEDLRRSLEAQTHDQWTHQLFEFLPNREAHKRLYNAFMARQDSFDLFVKLDADMVFRRDTALEEIIQLYQDSPQLDQAILAVFDWYSNRLRIGLHTFSDRVRWDSIDDPRFVDPHPEFPGEQRKIWSAPAPVVDHSPNPSGYQAFRFGVHQALKIIQPNRDTVTISRSRGKWDYLAQCMTHYLNSDDKRLFYALVGAGMVLNRELDAAHYDGSDDDLKEVFRRVRAQAPADLGSKVPNFGAVGLQKEFLLKTAIGPKRVASAFLSKLKRKASDQISYVLG